MTLRAALCLFFFKKQDGCMVRLYTSDAFCSVKMQGLIPEEDDNTYGLAIYDTTHPKKPRKKPWKPGVDRRYDLYTYISKMQPR